jgi:predicted RND superfamily exporter protein
MNILERFRNFLIHSFEFCYKYHALTIGLTIVTFLGIMAFFTPLEMRLSVDELINKDDPIAQEYLELKKDFNLHTNTFIIFQNKDHVTFNESELCQIKKWVILNGLNFPEIRETYSPLFLRESKLDISSAGFERLTFPTIVDLNCELPNRNENLLKPLGATPWMGVLVNNNYQDFAHEYQVGGPSQKNFIMERIVPLLENFKKTAKDLPARVKVHWLGDASYQAEMAKGVVYNNFLNILVVIFILVSFRFFFGTWISGIIYLVTLIYSCGIILGLMSIAGTPMDILNSSLFLFLAVSSLGDFIFLSQHELDRGHASRDWSETFRELITPCFFTSFTTFIGFISLCTSELEIISRLGFWVGLSGAVEWIATLLILPAIMKVCLKKKSWVNAEKSFSLSSLQFLDKINFPRYLCYLLLSVFLIVPFCFSHLNVSDSPMALFKKGNPFKESIDYLFNTRGFKGDVSLVFKDEKNEDFNRKILDHIKQDANVVKIENPYEILDFYTKSLNPSQVTVMKENLKTGPQFKRYFSGDKLRAVIYLKDVDLLKLYEMEQDISSKYCPEKECSLSGLLVAYASFSQKVSHTLLSSFTLSFCLVMLTVFLLSYYTSNIKFIFPLMASSLWGGAMVLVALAFFQIKINFVTSLVIAIMVGMNGDNTIQFILSGMDKGIYEGIKQRAVGSILTTFLLMMSSLVFLFHYFEPPKTFGLLLMFGFLMALVGDLWILKGLLPKQKE